MSTNPPAGPVPAKPEYEVVDAIRVGETDYPPGTVTNALPSSAIPWLLESGHIRKPQPKPPQEVADV